MDINSLINHYGTIITVVVATITLYRMLKKDSQDLKTDLTNKLDKIDDRLGLVENRLAVVENSLSVVENDLKWVKENNNMNLVIATLIGNKAEQLHQSQKLN